MGSKKTLQERMDMEMKKSHDEMVDQIVAEEDVGQVVDYANRANVLNADAFEAITKGYMEAFGY
jgi:hypothetical protein